MQNVDIYSHVKIGIVLGCPRSGTTFIMNALNTFPDVESASGVLLPAGICQIVNQPMPQEVYDALAIEFDRSLHRYLSTGWYRSRAGALQKWFAAQSGLRGLLDALKGRRQLTSLIYKEPFLSFAPEFVRQALPAAPILHIYRDGRDCAHSLVRTYDVLTDAKLTNFNSAEMRWGRKIDHRFVPWWVEDGMEEEFLKSTPYVRAVWMWKIMVRRCRNYFSTEEEGDRHNVLSLCYETLMRNPKDTGQQIADHFGLMPNKKFQKAISSAHTRSIGKYKSRNSREIAEANRIAGAELRVLGYEVRGDKPHTPLTR